MSFTFCLNTSTDWASLISFGSVFHTFIPWYVMLLLPKFRAHLGSAYPFEAAKRVLKGWCTSKFWNITDVLMGNCWFLLLYTITGVSKIMSCRTLSHFRFFRRRSWSVLSYVLKEMTLEALRNCACLIPKWKLVTVEYEDWLLITLKLLSVSRFWTRKLKSPHWAVKFCWLLYSN